MIQANELRLNNLITAKMSYIDPNTMTMMPEYHTAVCSVKTIGVVSLEVKEPGRLTQTVSCGVCEPIPLTEEWLVKLGFARDSELWHSLGDISIRNRKDHFQFYFGSKGYLVTVTYTHQLQNLYFALVGTELVIQTQNP